MDRKLYGCVIRLRDTVDDTVDDTVNDTVMIR